MKSVSLILIFLTAGLLNNLGAATVKGRVLNSRNSAPLQGAIVVLAGTTKGNTAEITGVFTLQDVPAGKHTLSASLIGYKHAQVPIEVDSATQVVEVTILMKLESQPPIVSGCIPDFVKYQSDLASYVTTNPSSLSFQISDFEMHDSADESLVLKVTNDTPFDAYLLKDHGYGMQMYVQKLHDASSTSVESKVMLYDKTAGRLVHDLSDVVRVPRHQTVVVDTVRLWQYDFAHLQTGEYKLQLVYAFPQSRTSPEDKQYRFASPIADEKAIGELYCMTLQGRFESNWLTIQIK